MGMKNNQLQMNTCDEVSAVDYEDRFWWQGMNFGTVAFISNIELKGSDSNWEEYQRKSGLQDELL